jgi:hypothetical protein
MSRFVFATGLIMVSSALSLPAHAAEIGGTSWNLSGKVSGKVGVTCKVGGRAVSAATPVKKYFRESDVNANRKLDAKITFSPGALQPDGVTSAGTFEWTEDELSALPALTGTWEQKKNRIGLKFDNWAASPISVAANAMAQGFSAIAGNSYSQGGATLSIEDTDEFDDNVKYNFGGKLNPNGTSLSISEVFGFKFKATGSAMGASNTCTFKISSFGRNYKGTPAQ